MGLPFPFDVNPVDLASREPLQVLRSTVEQVPVPVTRTEVVRVIAAEHLTHDAGDAHGVDTAFLGELDRGISVIEVSLDLPATWIEDLAFPIDEVSRGLGDSEPFLFRGHFFCVPFIISLRVTQRRLQARQS